MIDLEGRLRLAIRAIEDAREQAEKDALVAGELGESVSLYMGKMAAYSYVLGLMDFVLTYSGREKR